VESTLYFENRKEVETMANNKFLGIDLSDRAKANFLSRFFGIFYEGLMEDCFKSKGYVSEGRPSVYDKHGKYQNITFDYTVTKDNKMYLVEAKCWIAYQDFKYFELTHDILQSKWQYYKETFKFFLELGSMNRPSDKYKFYCDGKEDYFQPDGKILIWAKVNKKEVGKIREAYNLTNIFPIEDMIMEMRGKKEKDKRDYLNYAEDRLK
jgi:hypothetical protein